MAAPPARRDAPRRGADAECARRARARLSKRPTEKPQTICPEPLRLGRRTPPTVVVTTTNGGPSDVQPPCDCSHTAPGGRSGWLERRLEGGGAAARLRGRRARDRR